MSENLLHPIQQMNSIRHNPTPLKKGTRISLLSLSTTRFYSMHRLFNKRNYSTQMKRCYSNALQAFLCIGEYIIPNSIPLFSTMTSPVFASTDFTVPNATPAGGGKTTRSMYREIRVLLPLLLFACANAQVARHSNDTSSTYNC